MAYVLNFNKYTQLKLIFQTYFKSNLMQHKIHSIFGAKKAVLAMRVLINYLTKTFLNSRRYPPNK